MPADSTLNDKAWRKIFESLPLLESIRNEGKASITSDQIKSFGQGREPRLMAKMDLISDRPSVFQEHDLNILPTSRGTYIIFRDEDNRCYVKLPPHDVSQAPREYNSSRDRSFYKTLPAGLCTTESEAIDLAFLSSLICSFCADPDLVLTRRGRFGSNRFLLRLPNGEEVTIAGAQVEVDAVYESRDRVVFIEAKMGFRSDCNIRQLLYPIKWIQEKAPDKQILALLLCYSNGMYQLSQFDGLSDLQPPRLLRQETYIINEHATSLVGLARILRFEPSAKEDMSIPFPQADDLDKVVDLVLSVSEGMTTDEELCDYFGFVGRQAGYYTNAARYLGFLSHGTPPVLTRIGDRLLTEPVRENRVELILKAVLSRPALRESVLLLKAKEYDAQSISAAELSSIIQHHRYDVSGTTVTRRAQTVKSWLKWLAANCDLET